MAKLLRASDDRWIFWCEGCDSYHFVDRRWTFNGNQESPTFQPSLLVRSGHYSPDHTGDCWCDYNAKHPDEPSKFACSVCHSYVTDGKMQYLSDSTHALAGQTVPLREES